MIKDAFYFTLKAIFVLLRYSKFCPDSYGHVGKQPDKKTKTNFKIFEVKNWEIAIYILSNIPRSIGNQTIQSGQLTEYNMKNTFP